MAAFIAANAYRIFWCYKQQKEGMITPVRELVAWIRRRLDEGERAAREQLQKQQSNLARIGLTTGSSARDRRRSARTAGQRRGRQLRGRGGFRSGRTVRVDGGTGDGDEGDAAADGIGLSVVVTPPTPHWKRASAVRESKDSADGEMEMAPLQGVDSHERALIEGDEPDEEDRTLNWKEGHARDDADELQLDEDGDEDEDKDDAAEAMRLPSESNLEVTEGDDAAIEDEDGGNLPFDAEAKAEPSVSDGGASRHEDDPDRLIHPGEPRSDGERL